MQLHRFRTEALGAYLSRLLHLEDALYASAAMPLPPLPFGECGRLRGSILKRASPAATFLSLSPSHISCTQSTPPLPRPQSIRNLTDLHHPRTHSLPITPNLTMNDQKRPKDSHAGHTCSHSPPQPSSASTFRPSSLANHPGSTASRATTTGHRSHAGPSKAGAASEVSSSWSKYEATPSEIQRERDDDPSGLRSAAGRSSRARTSHATPPQSHASRVTFAGPPQSSSRTPSKMPSSHSRRDRHSHDQRRDHVPSRSEASFSSAAGMSGIESAMARFSAREAARSQQSVSAARHRQGRNRASTPHRPSASGSKLLASVAQAKQGKSRVSVIPETSASEPKLPGADSRALVPYSTSTGASAVVQPTAGEQGNSISTTKSGKKGRRTVTVTVDID